VRGLRLSHRVARAITEADTSAARFVAGDDERLGWGAHVVDVLVARAVFALPETCEVLRESPFCTASQSVALNSRTPARSMVSRATLSSWWKSVR